MKECISYCLVGSALLGSMLVMMLSSKKSKNFTHYKSLLDDNQLQVYKSVLSERMSIYIQGLVIGTILALLVTYKRILSKTHNICVFMVIALGFNWVYYLFYPKSTFMLSHLNSQNQVKAWIKIYKEMKLRCHLGLLLGIIGYFVLGMGWC